jgi:chromosome segregation ATPase
VKFLADNTESKVYQLEKELVKKELEINDLFDKIELLEDNMMKYEEIDIEEALAGNTKVLNKLMKSKLAVRLSTEEKDNRDLKNKLGFLRKEKIQLQKELSKYKRPKSSVIKIDEMEGRKKSLHSLIEELQVKLNKQQIYIQKLKSQIAMGSGDASEILKEKDKEIQDLKSRISKLAGGSGSVAVDRAGSGSGNLLTVGLTEDLQEKLNKARRQIESLTQKLKEHEKSGNQKDLDKDGAEIKSLKVRIEELKKELELKANIANKPFSAGSSASLTAELQDKLSKTRVQVRMLEEKLKNYQDKEKKAKNVSQEKMEEEIMMQKEKVTLLQQEINEQQQTLSVKEQKIIDLSNQVKNSGTNTPVTTIEEGTNNKEIKSHVALRLRELKNVVDDLKKQNIQQRFEISQLRKT